MHKSCLDWCTEHIQREEIAGKRILEVGSWDQNGSVRPRLEGFKPAAYVGTDIVSGEGVDVVCDARELTKEFGKASFDVVLSTEMLEHVRDWRKVITNLKLTLKPGGLLVLTTRSRGFPYHYHPYDFWRFEPADIRKIFREFKIIRLDRDETPGVLFKARKPLTGRPAALSGIRLFSVHDDRRVCVIRESSIKRSAQTVELLREVHARRG